MFILSAILFPHYMGRQVIYYSGTICFTLILILTVQNFYYKQLKIPKDRFTLLFFLFVILNFLSVFWANNISLIWTKAAFWAMLWIFYINIRSLNIGNFNASFWKVLILAIVGINIILSIYAYSVFAFSAFDQYQFTFFKIEKSTNVFNTNGNFIASLFAISSIPLIYLAQTKGRFKTLIIYPLLFLSVIFSLLHNSRGAAIALILSLILSVFYVSKQTNSKKAIAALIFTILAFILFTFLLLDNPTKYFEQYNPLRTLFEKTGDDRLILWQYSMSLFAEQPFTGVGTGNWMIESKKFGVNAFFNTSDYGHAHNFIIETFSELGILGGLLIIYLFVAPIIYAIKNRKQNSIHLFVGIGLLTYLIVTSFYGVVYQSYKLMPIWSFLVAWQMSNKKSNSFILNWPIFGALLLSGFLFTSYQYYFEHSNHTYKKYRKMSKEKKESSTVFEDIYFPNIYEYFRSTHLNWLKAKQLDRTENTEAIELLEDAASKNPYNHIILHTLGKRYEYEGDYNKAIDCYKKSIQLNYRYLKASLALMKIGNRKKYWKEYDAGADAFINYAIPLKEKFYLDKPSKTFHNLNFWKLKCRLIDQYYITAHKRHRMIQDSEEVELNPFNE